jgi:hypothetical protein
MQRLQKFARDPADVRESIGVAIEVAEHHVLFGIEIGVVPILGKCQRVEKDKISTMTASQLLDTLPERWLLSLVFSPASLRGDKRGVAGCD